MPVTGYDISFEQSVETLAKFHFVRPRPGIGWVVPERDYEQYRILVPAKIEAPDVSDMVHLTTDDQRLLERALLASTEVLYEF